MNSKIYDEQRCVFAIRIGGPFVAYVPDALEIDELFFPDWEISDLEKQDSENE